MFLGILITDASADTTMGNVYIVRLLQNTIFRNFLVHFRIFVRLEIEVRCQSSFRANWLDSVVFTLRIIEVIEEEKCENNILSYSNVVLGSLSSSLIAACTPVVGFLVWKQS